jgi:hypothetical protein
VNKREELKVKLEQELQWVKYRQRMLDIMEGKLFQIKELAEQAKEGNFTAVELEALNVKINNLATQVIAIDSESRRNEHGRILE